MSMNLPAVLDTACYIGAPWEEQFIVNDVDLSEIAWQMRIKRASNQVSAVLIELSLGDGITAEYGDHEVDGEIVTGTLVICSMDPDTTQTLPETNTARHAIRDGDTLELYWEGQFDIRKSVYS